MQIYKSLTPELQTQAANLLAALENLTFDNTEAKSPKFFDRHSLKIFVNRKFQIKPEVFELEVFQKEIDQFLKTNFWTCVAANKISAQMDNYRLENWPDQLAEPIKADWDITLPNQFEKGFEVNQSTRVDFETLKNPKDEIISLDNEEEVLDY